MCESLLDPSGLKFLWKHRGNENYDLKSFISDGTFIQYIVLEDKLKCQKVLGKIVTSPGEGEAYHWPRLQHENLVPLLDTVSINETKSVYIFPFIGKSIGNVIHDSNFLNDSECFNRKKAYAEDILWALDYLHGKSLCLMNFTDLIIHVCNASDKAVICDFSCLFLTERATKDKIRLPTLYKAPEINTKNFEPIAAETWACGVMFLQIFTNHSLPSAFVGDEVYQVTQAVREINYDLIKESNPGCQLPVSDVESLKNFLDLFFVWNPKKRVKVQLAAVSSFLRTKINDGEFSEQLMESTANTTRHFQVLENNNKYKNSANFREIYLKEAAKYRDKLKQVSCTNKFINLHFVPECDNTTKSHENHYCTHRKASLTNRIAEKVSMDVQLPSDIESEDSVIGDNQAVISELCENDSPMEFLHEINFSKLGEKSKSFEDVIGENPLQSMDEYYRYLDGHKFSDISISSNGEDSVIRDILEDYEERELLQSKSHFSLQTNISTDSLDTLGNSESNLNAASKLSDSDLKFQNIGIFPCSKLEQKESKFSLPSQKAHYFTEVIQTKPEVRKSDLTLENISVKCKRNLVPSKSDSYIANLPEVKNKSYDFPLLDSEFLGSHSNSSNSKQIMLLDSANLNKILNDNIAGYSWKSYGFIKNQTKKTLQVPHAKSSESCNEYTSPHLKIKCCSQNMNKLSNKNDCKLSKHKDSAKSLKLCNIASKNLQEDNVIVSNIKDNEVMLKPMNYNQSVEKVNYCRIRRNSYEQAISNTQTNAIKPKTINRTNNLFSKLKKIKTIPFKNFINNNKFSSKKQPNCSCFSDTTDYNYPKELAAEQNSSMTPTLEHTCLDMDISLLTNEQGEYRKQDKKPQKMKNKWIQYLCPGSRTH